MNNLFLVVGKDAYDMHSTMKPVKKKTGNDKE